MKKLLLIAITLIFSSCKTEKIVTDFYQSPEKQSSRVMNRCGGGSAGFSNGIDKILAGGFGMSAGRAGCSSREANPPPLLIKKATLRYEVKDFSATKTQISSLIQSSGAYIADDRETKSEVQISKSMTIRVPDSKFENLLDSLALQAKNLDERYITVQDVTEEYVDTEMRLKAKKAIENRYLDILKKAQNVKDILEVEEKLGEIRQEIESSEGRLKYLSHQVSFSSIDLTFYENFRAAPVSRVGFFSKTRMAFSNGWDGLGEFFISCIAIWPFWLIVSGVVIAVIAIVRKKRRDRPSAD
jgi:hypothetical protein